MSSSPRKAKHSFTFKELTGQVHLWLGLACGLVVLVVALSGSILVFEDELEPVIYKKEMVVEAQPVRLPLDTLMAQARQAFPKLPLRQVRVYPAADRSVLVSFGGKKKEEQRYAFVNPYTGKVLGKGFTEKRFFEVVTRLHRYLLAGKTGKVITGISCSMFFILTISGIVIWWPANKNAVKQRFKIKWDGSFKRVNWDFHAVFGFYSSLFLIAIALTGLIWSYDWIDNLMFTLADGKKEKNKIVANKSALPKAEAGLYEKVYQAAGKTYAFEGKMYITMPADDSLAITVVKYDDKATVSNKVSTVWFDAKTGEQLQKQPFSKLSTGSKMRRMVYPIHTGSIYGWPTKILALMVSLFAASLPVTGLLIWLGRKKKAKKKQPMVAKRRFAVESVQL